MTRHKNRARRRNRARCANHNDPWYVRMPCDIMTNIFEMLSLRDAIRATIGIFIPRHRNEISDYIEYFKRRSISYVPSKHSLFSDVHTIRELLESWKSIYIPAYRDMFIIAHCRDKEYMNPHITENDASLYIHEFSIVGITLRGVMHMIDIMKRPHIGDILKHMTELMRLGKYNDAYTIYNKVDINDPRLFKYGSILETILYNTNKKIIHATNAEKILNMMYYRAYPYKIILVIMMYNFGMYEKMIFLLNNARGTWHDDNYAGYMWSILAYYRLKNYTECINLYNKLISIIGHYDRGHFPHPGDVRKVIYLIMILTYDKIPELYDDNCTLKKCSVSNDIHRAISATTDYYNNMHMRLNADTGMVTSIIYHDITIPGIVMLDVGDIYLIRSIMRKHGRSNAISVIFDN
jgi:tetratricopeptide (TPR) repeat protein